MRHMCKIFLHILKNPKMSGVYNGVAPNPVSNYELTKAMAKAKKIMMLPIPTPPFALRLALGEMADVVLDGARVSSDKIKSAGYEFAYPNVIPAIEDLLKRKI